MNYGWKGSIQEFLQVYLEVFTESLTGFVLWFSTPSRLERRSNKSVLATKSMERLLRKAAMHS